MEKENDYNKDIYEEYEEDIKKYINEYSQENYSDILEKDKRTNIAMIFSEMRANIIKWYPFDSNKKILEIGANYGEITQELIKQNHDVTSIEFSEEKIRCIKKRVKDVENLKLIFCTSLKELELKDKYDYITIIGISEYAEKLGFKNLEEMLRWSYKYLATDGKILLAIDNKFGAKYFAGSTRNKNENPFAIFKPYIQKDYKLYGKSELENILNNSGDIKYKFYYPVPNYNLTHLIYTDEYLPKHSRYNIYYREDEEILFNELSLIKEAQKNNKFDFFTNSYLIEIAKEDTKFSDIIYVNYSNMRKKEYKIITKISPQIVTKQAYIDEENSHIRQIKQNIIRLKELGFNICEEEQNNIIISPYIAKPTMDEYLKNLLEQDKINEFKQELDKWYNYINNKIEKNDGIQNILKKYSIDVPEEAKLIILKDGFVDLTFTNVFYNGNEYVLFDQEWYEEGVPLEFIMYRSIKQLFFQHSGLENKVNLNEIYQKYNIERFIPKFDELEEKWQQSMIDKNIMEFYSEKWTRNISIEDIKFRFNQQLGTVYKEKDKLELENKELREELQNNQKSHIQEEMQEYEKIIEDLQKKIQELQHRENKLQKELTDMKNDGKLNKLMKFFKNKKIGK